MERPVHQAPARFQDRGAVAVGNENNSIPPHHNKSSTTVRNPSQVGVGEFSESTRVPIGSGCRSQDAPIGSYHHKRVVAKADSSPRELHAGLRPRNPMDAIGTRKWDRRGG